MEVLRIQDLERHNKDSILFPSFSITISKNDITAIHSSLNVRSVLLDMLVGKRITNGEIRVNKESLLTNKAAYVRQIGICFFNEGHYERLSVLDHLKFYKGLYESKQTFNQILRITQLEEKKHTKLKNLTYSETKRVQFARLLFQDPSLFVFEEADVNVDVETKRVFVNLTRKLQQDGKGILILTGNMESAFTVAEHIYRLDEKGLHKVNIDSDMTQEVQGEDDKEPNFIQFNKIPTKINEKIVLFDPLEIDYIESQEGQSNLYIKGEAFPTSFTLNELEERLQHYGFFRCHRSYIVNLQKVREVITWTRNSYSLVLEDTNKSSIPLSKTKMAQLKDMLGLK